MKPEITLKGLQESGRRHYRMIPVHEDPVSLRINGEPVALENLSANGVAFQAFTPLAAGTHEAQLNFSLEGRDFSIFCQVKLVRTRSGGYAGELRGLKEIDERLLSRFIVACQRAAIQREQERKAPRGL